MAVTLLPCADGVCVCDSCGVRFVTRPGINLVAHDCTPPKPSLAQTVANFATSAAKHVAAGMPRATDEEIERRFSICQGCEFFDGKACRKCGCGISRVRRFVSKLAWANEKCPVGKW